MNASIAFSIIALLIMAAVAGLGFLILSPFFMPKKTKEPSEQHMSRKEIERLGTQVAKLVYDRYKECGYHLLSYWDNPEQPKELLEFATQKLKEVGLEPSSTSSPGRLKMILGKKMAFSVQQIQPPPLPVVELNYSLIEDS